MTPVIGRKLIERESLLRARLEDASGLFQMKRLEFGGNLFRFLTGGFFSLLRVDGLQHGRNHFGFTSGDGIQNVPVKMYHTALPAAFREKISYGVQKAGDPSPQNRSIEKLVFLA